MNRFTVFSFLLVLFSLMMTIEMTAQKEFTNGSISYKVITIDGPDYLKPMMKGGRARLHIRDHMVNLELNMMKGMVKSQRITNHKTDTSYMLNQMMGDKTAVLLDTPDFSTPYEISYNKKATKEILGYSCHQAIIKLEDTTVKLYVTDKISALNQFKHSYGDLKGFPLEYVMDQNGVTLTFQASAISHEVPDPSKFVIPTDFELMTLAEFEAAMRGKAGM